MPIVAMQWFEWRDAAETKASWLTLGWLRGLALGCPVELCVLDRNTCDSVTSAHPVSTPLPPEVFFSEQRIVFTKTSAYSGTFEHTDCNVVKHGAPFDIEMRSATLATGNNSAARMSPDFQWYFYPVHCSTSMQAWDALGDDTWIGWRGPALLWSALANQHACVHWLDE